MDNKIEAKFNGIKDKMKKQKERAEKPKESNNKNTNVNKNVNTNVNKNYPQIKVKKKKQQKEKYKRQTYYMTPKLISKIDEYSQLSGHNKSELVRLALSYFFEHLKIEE